METESLLKPQVCSKCGGSAKGFRCDSCGVETLKFDPNHVCGARHLVLKCLKCNEPETKCFCEAQTARSFWG